MLDENVVAHHEAGHVLAAYALRRAISSVELTESGGQFRPYDRASWEPTTAEGKQAYRDAVLQSIGPQHLEEMLPMLIEMAAGLAAQRRLVGRLHDDYADHDIEQVESIARAVAPGEERQLLVYAQEQAELIVAQHWHAIEAVAAELLLHRRLDAAEIMASRSVPPLAGDAHGNRS